MPHVNFTGCRLEISRPTSSCLPSGPADTFSISRGRGLDLQQMCQQHLFASGRRAWLSSPTLVCSQVSRNLFKSVDTVIVAPRCAAAPPSAGPVSQALHHARVLTLLKPLRTCRCLRGGDGSDPGDRSSAGGPAAAVQPPRQQATRPPSATAAASGRAEGAHRATEHGTEAPAR